VSSLSKPKRRGGWTRWGRGMCEGWSLEIGPAFRGSVVRSDTPGMPTTWIASINTSAIGEYLTLEIAMRQVEERIESDMSLVLHDWELYRSAKASRAG
jgi:hypothetical protein